ncbi:LLM class flavin-dependent oxidoreductase [Corynebacterium amycolatum]|uniref:LLM class flavin-dependent oxidoreductase n=1 Tax=Corynebacterium amycolatum TaxID=43765 RepID=UPI000185C3B4|nr:LLM class flavin-dependent oxidoreductase [Corynebacterium amycolatum]EEB63258.1 putative alkanesulfonate monooxygenase, FMNH(2)-dependent [Corynebacterium amycolatum SK46]
MADNNTVTLHWFLPTYGDSRAIMAGGHGTDPHIGERKADLHYLTQLALAAEANGFESVLTPTGQWCEDAWLTTAALIGRTTRLKFLVALRPGLVSPTIIAQQAQTFQDLSHNRLLVNVVVGGEDHEQRAFGDHLNKQQRYARADEVLTITNHLLTNPDPIDFNGQYLTVEGAQLKSRPQVAPPIYFGGSSKPGIDVAAKHADVYLTWGEPPQKVSEKITRVQAQADQEGRELGYGIRLHVIARETSEEAWAVAERLLADLDPDTVARIQAGLARSQSEGQRRMTELHNQGGQFTTGATARDLEIAPNLWTGVGLVRGGAGTALVGSYEEVAERIAEYRHIGLEHFVLSGYPHLEETYHVGEGVVPALQRLGIDVTNHDRRSTSQNNAVPFVPATR